MGLLKWLWVSAVCMRAIIFFFLPLSAVAVSLSLNVSNLYFSLKSRIDSDASIRVTIYINFVYYSVYYLSLYLFIFFIFSICLFFYILLSLLNICVTQLLGILWSILCAAYPCQDNSSESSPDWWVWRIHGEGIWWIFSDPSDPSLLFSSPHNFSMGSQGTGIARVRPWLCG